MTAEGRVTGAAQMIVTLRGS